MAVENVTSLFGPRSVSAYDISTEDPVDLDIDNLPEDGLEFEVDLTDGTSDLFMEAVAEDPLAVPHDANLAQAISEAGGELDLDLFGLSLVEQVIADKESRAEWEQVFTDGLKLMGIMGSGATASETEILFEGASQLFHPLITEACVHFQAEALKATLPPQGPVNSKVVGTETPEKLAQARRVKNFLNYQVTEEIIDYFEEHDKLLAYVGKSGSAFKKIWFNRTSTKIEVSYLPAEQVIVPYSATSLRKTPRVTYVDTISKAELDHRIANGLYRDVGVMPVQAYVDQVQEELNAQQGVTDTAMMEQDEYCVYEVHVDTVIPRFEGDRGGLSAPYIVHVDKETGKVLGLYRNWREGDPVYQRREFFVHYPLVQSDGFYGYGFIHLVGQFARAATSVLRQLLDAGTLANLQSGFKRKGTRMAREGEAFQPGEFRDVEVFGERLQDSIMQLKFSEPSTVLYQLLGFLVDGGRRLVSLTDINVGDGNQEAPVGTTIALLERGMNVMSAVHMRICRAMRQEFKIMARICAEKLPEQYPYDVPGETREVFKADFDDRVDVMPVCDPRQFSQAQRIARAQNKLQLTAQAPPGMMDQREAYRDMLAEIDESNIDRIMPPQQQAQPKDPMTENGDAIQGNALKAFIEQNHKAHIQAHVAQLQNPQFGDNVSMQQALQAHIQEHMAMDYQVTMMQVMGVSDLQQLSQLPPEQLAVMAAQATQQVTGTAQAMAEAEARAAEPTLEQQALLQEIQNNQQELEYEHQKNQQDAALERYKVDRKMLADVMGIKQRDRASELNAAAQVMQMNLQHRQSMSGQFIDLFSALQDENQQEQQRDSRTSL